MKRILFFCLGMLICLPAQAAEWMASADVRERYQIFNNLDFNSAADADTQEWDTRFYLKTLASFDNGLSLYLQPQAIYIQNYPAAGGTEEFSQADLYQAFVRFEMGNAGIKVGRQRLAYGDERLLGGLSWKDVSRTFDGVKAYYRGDSVKLDAFAVHPADITSMTPTSAIPKGESLVTLEDQRLIGGYGTYLLAPGMGMDGYFINWHINQKAAANNGRNINTFGGRLFGYWHGLDMTAEYVLQRGSWTSGISQRASALAVKAGYTFNLWRTRIGAEFDYSPGDDKLNTARHKTFVFPFHTNHGHYGAMDRFSWANMRDLRFSLSTSPAEGLVFQADTHLLWLDDARDDWLDVVGTSVLFAGGTTLTNKRAGTEVDLQLNYRLSMIEGLSVSGNYSFFNPGGAVNERNSGKLNTASFGYVIVNYIF